MGALTSKQFEFQSRSWEVTNYYTFDIFSSEGIPIIIHYRGRAILRVLPRYSKELSFWLPDVSRISYFAFKQDRLVHPLIYGVDQNFYRLEWEDVRRFTQLIFDAIFRYYARDLNCLVVITVSVIGDIKNHAAFHFWQLAFSQYFKFVEDVSYKYSWVNFVSIDSRNIYITEDRLQSLWQYDLDALLLIGMNLRLDFPLLNSQLRGLTFVTKLKLFSTYENKVFMDFPFFDLGSVSSFFYFSFIGRLKLFKVLQYLTGAIIFGSFCFLILTERIFSFNLLHSIFLRYSYFLLFFAIECVGNLSTLEIGTINTALEKNYNMSDMIYYSILQNIAFPVNSLLHKPNVFSAFHGSNNFFSIMCANLMLPCFNYLEENVQFFFWTGFLRDVKCLLMANYNARPNYYIFVYLYARFAFIRSLNYSAHYYNMRLNSLHRGFFISYK